MPTQFAKGIFRNPITNVKIDTENYTKRDNLGSVIAGGLSSEDLTAQGFERFGNEAIDDTIVGTDINKVEDSIIESDTTETPGTISADRVYAENDAQQDELKRSGDLLRTEQLGISESTQALMAEIREDYNASVESAKGAQQDEKATQEAIQFKLGQSGTGYGMEQLRRSDLARQAELDSLLSTKEGLILKAERAARDDNVKLLKEYNKEIQDIDDKYYDRKREQRQDQIKEYLDLSEEDRAVRKEVSEFEEADKKSAQTQIEQMAEGGIEAYELSEEEVSTYEETLGLLPGTFNAYYSNLVDAQKFKEQNDDVGFYKSLKSMLDTFPEGEMIQIGDTLYEGSEKADIYQFKEEDAQGYVVSIGVDKQTGEELWRQNHGKIGKGFKATGIGTSEETAADLYESSIKSYIEEGITDASAIAMDLQQLAEESGINLSVKDLNAIRRRAEDLIFSSQIGSVDKGDTGSDFISDDIETGDIEESFIDPETGEYTAPSTFMERIGIKDQFTLDKKGNIIKK